MSTRFETRLSEADLLAGFRLNAHNRAVRPLLLTAALLMAVLVLLAVICGLALYSLTHDPLTLMLEGAVALAILLVALILLLRPAILRGLAQRTLRQRADLAQPIRWEFDGEHLRHTTIYADSRYPWGTLQGWRENETTLLVYVADNVFYAIPKAQVAADTLDALRRQLQAAGVRSR